MAIIEHASTETQHILSSSHLIGRSHVCALRCHNPRASAEHAVVRWTGAGWEIRDLASSNGTYVDTIRLRRGSATGLKVGARMAFGDPLDTFVLIDDAAPVLRARADDGSTVYAEDGVLAIPTPDHYQYLIHESENPGVWQLELATGDSRIIDNHESVSCGGRHYCIELPAVMPPTLQASRVIMYMRDIRLQFEVSEDGADIDITVVHATGHHRLPHRHNADLLLHLARQRLQDERESLPAAERGWVEREQLIRSLTEYRLRARSQFDRDIMTPEQINVEVYRARNQFRKAGVEDGSRIVERRRTSRSLRLGTARIEIAQRGTLGVTR